METFQTMVSETSLFLTYKETKMYYILVFSLRVQQWPFRLLTNSKFFGAKNPYKGLAKNEQWRKSEMFKNILM